MKKTSEETMRKFVAFCDSGRPWYFTLGMSVTVLIVQFALWFAADEDKKPGWWYTVPAWFGISALWTTSTRPAKTGRAMRNDQGGTLQKGLYAAAFTRCLYYPG